MKAYKPGNTIILSAATSILLALGSFNVFAVSTDIDQLSGISSKTYRLIIKYRNQKMNKSSTGSAKRNAKSLSQAIGTKLKYVRSTATNSHVMKLDWVVSMTEAKDIADQIAMHPDVLYARPDGIRQAAAVPSDPLYEQQPHYSRPYGGVNLPDAWDVSTGENVVVAVIDTGYRPHVDLQDNLLPGYDFISDAFVANDGDMRDNDAKDPGDWLEPGDCGDDEPFFGRNSSWHGTHVAGIVAASSNNDIGVTGVAWDAKILPVRVLGKCGGFDSDIIDAMYWAAGISVVGVPDNPNPAKVLNLSLGGVDETGEGCPLEYRDAIEAVMKAGATVVVAAGNDGEDASSYVPANCPGVITVGATNFWGASPLFSNFGSIVDVSAPGAEFLFYGGILSTINTGLKQPVEDGYGDKIGTSMSTPHISGVAALMYALQPDLEPGRVKEIIKETAQPFVISCSLCGTGIVDAAAAVNSVDTDKAEPSTSSSFNNFKNIDIPDADPSGAVILFQVDNSGNSKTVNILVAIDHDRIEDLDIQFITPDGTYAQLNESSSSGNTKDYKERFVFDVSDISDQGTWKLSVVDKHSGNSGYIDSFTMDFE